MTERNKDIPEEMMNWVAPDSSGILNQEVEGAVNNKAEIKELVASLISNTDFIKRIAPYNAEAVSEQAFENALDKILKANIDVSKEEKLALFRQTLEYYSHPPTLEKPLWHSTSSYALRKSLEDGLSGGHGKFSGEAGATNAENEEIQRGLSVSHPEYPYAETFQQLFARLSAKKVELSNFIKIDSEKITGKSLPEVFANELLNALSREEIQELLAKRAGVSVDQITHEMVERAVGEESKKAFADSFNRREYVPNLTKIKNEILPSVRDTHTRSDLGYEAEHPFPCLITLESAGKEDNLTTVSRGEKPTHIPFEDFYWGTFSGEDIKEVRVPQNQIPKVKSWFKQKKLENVKILPIEIYEIKRIIQDSI